MTNETVGKIKVLEGFAQAFEMLPRDLDTCLQSRRGEFLSPNGKLINAQFVRHHVGPGPSRDTYKSLYEEFKVLGKAFNRPAKAKGKAKFKLVGGTDFDGKRKPGEGNR